MVFNYSCQESYKKLGEHFFPNENNQYTQDLIGVWKILKDVGFHNIIFKVWEVMELNVRHGK